MTRLQTSIKPLATNGTLVFGRKTMYEQVLTNAFLGRISSFKFVISDDKISDTNLLCSEDANTHNWLLLDEFEFTMVGLTIKEINFDPCSLDRNGYTTFIFPMQSTHEDAFGTCRRLGSTMTTIVDENQNVEIAQLLDNFPNMCAGIIPNQIVGWLGNLLSEDLTKSAQLFNPTDQIIQDSFNASSGNGINDSNSFFAKKLLLVSNSMWKLAEEADVGCPICAASQFNVTFFLQGLCKESHKMIRLYPRFYDGTNELYFQSNIDLVLLFTHAGWTLMNDNPSSLYIIATLSSNQKLFGRNKWSVSEIIRRCDPADPFEELTMNMDASGTPQELTLSSCNSDQFVCNDGSCIPKEARCSRYVDCNDGSDELKCSMYNFESEYMKYYDPSVPPNKKTLQMLVFTTLLKVRYD